MKKELNEFCGQKNGYSRSITVRNRLVPIGKTEETIKKYLVSDKQKADAYSEVKRLIDDFHRSIIADVLNGKYLKWYPLAAAIKEFQKTSDSKSKDKVKKEQDEMRKLIVKLFKDDSRFEKIFKKELISELLPGMIENDTTGVISSRQAAVEQFNRFTTYFIGFHENRKNLYSSEDKSTAIGFRLVHENFPKFLANISLFESIQKDYPQIITDTENSLSTFLNGIKLECVFTIDYFNSVMTQKGIDFYNQIIGGMASGVGTEKTKGFNEHINLFRQTLTSEQQKNFRGKMAVLFKQILSDRETASFIPVAFQNDKEVYDSIKAFYTQNLKGAILLVKELFSKKEHFDLTKILVPKKVLSEFSIAMTGHWGTFDSCLWEAGIKKYGEPKTETAEKRLKKSIAKDAYSLAELAACYKKRSETNEFDSYEPTIYFSLQSINKDVKKEYVSIVDNINELYSKIIYDEKNSLRNKRETSIPIKYFLDAAQNFYHYLKFVDYKGEQDKDSEFYSQFDEIIQNVEKVIPLYNKVRNYVTQKIGEDKKFKLFFDCPTLAAGWDENKEQQNNAILLKKEGKYFLGIINPKNKIRFDNCSKNDEADCYQKMVYKLLPGPNKMLPKVFFSTKGKDAFNPPENILSGYNKGKHLKGDTFDLNFCHQLIDWFKNAINRHEDWKKFNFKFSQTEKYTDISVFYNEVAEQGYKLSFTNIPASVIDTAIENEQLFLFQIYNKDFAEKTTGKKNLHTLYWENLFSEENIKDTVLKLNGEAELFFRSSSIKPEDISVHEKGSILLNRTAKDGQTIPENLYQELYLYLNDKSTKKLSNEAQDLLNRDILVQKKASHRIIKNRHYTQDTYLFHCPITMNFKAPEITGKKFNEKVLAYLRDNSDIKIIGLDRGERHLIYLSLINQRGEIELQKTLNVVEYVRTDKSVSVNYQEKLVQKEIERDKARKDWQTIGNIKELKEGYLSAIVHEIACLIIEHNAIVVMEDLNFGFKRGRFAVERQVYQKFEKMLIDKLNYFVFKNRLSTDAGGVLNAYQLTDKFTSFKELGKQCGWLFYVPAAYTSKIDPKTGFVNLFRTQGLTNIDKKKNFFDKFQAIRYNRKEDCFVFSFDYSDFGETVDYHKKWEIYTNGERYVYNSRERKSLVVFPTENLKKIFTQMGINWNTDENFIEALQEIQAERKNTEFYDALYRAFSATLQMRNSKVNSGKPEDDYIISPIKANDGTFYDSRKQAEQGENAKLPIDADANGAYHIALKGLYLLKNNFALDDRGYISSISNADWFHFVQEKTYLNG